jgi:hypothetical protein
MFGEYRLADRVAAYLRDIIQKSNMRPGDRLPGKAEISRGVLGVQSVHLEIIAAANGVRVRPGDIIVQALNKVKGEETVRAMIEAGHTTQHIFDEKGIM